MTRAGPFPRWLWDPTTCAWLLLRADGTLHEEGGPGDPPVPTDPLVRLKLQGWREYRPDGTSVPIDPSVFEGAEFVLPAPPPPEPRPMGERFPELEQAPACPRCGGVLGIHFPDCVVRQ